jgi:alkylated DNA repair dioxygenase AlkB
MHQHHEVVRESRSTDVEYLLSRLSPELREVAILRVFEDLSYQGVAARLGCPLWKARRLISQSLRTLRELCGVQVLEIAPGQEVRYFPHFLPKPEADIWLSRLLAEVPFQTETATMVPKRQMAVYGAHYDYSPTAQPARAWSPLLTELRVLVQQAICKRFDSALCNLYPDGEAYIGWHHDAGHPIKIASVSLGAVRTLLFAEKGSTRAVRGIELGHGSLLLIPQAVNDRFKHMVPKDRSITQPRINVTFRTFAPQNGILSGTAESGA